MQREAAKAANLRFVTPGYFAAMGIPLRRGREVSEADARERPSVAVVSDSFVRRYWPDQDPLGRHFQFAFGGHTVVGVVGDVRVRGLDRSSEPQVYLPYQQVADGALTYYAPKDLVVRSAASVKAVSEVRTLAAVVAEQTASRSLQLRVLGAFAAIAFLLAGIGIHGLLACAVSQRAREIGVRRALGARSADILTMVLRNGVLTAAMGVVPGWRSPTVRDGPWRRSSPGLSPATRRRSRRGGAVPADDDVGQRRPRAARAAGGPDDGGADGVGERARTQAAGTTLAVAGTIGDWDRGWLEWVVESYRGARDADRKPLREAVTGLVNPRIGHDRPVAARAGGPGFAPCPTGSTALAGRRRLSLLRIRE